MSSIDQVHFNSRLAYLGTASTPSPPRLHLVVLTCMDSRIDVFRLLGLRPGDANVLRNAGGRVTQDVVRSLAISQALLGTTEVMVLHHTDCARGRATDEEGVRELTRLTGHQPDFPILTFVDYHQSVLEDVRRLQQSPHLLHRDRIRGFLYDVAHNRVDEVQTNPST